MMNKGGCGLEYGFPMAFVDVLESVVRAGGGDVARARAACGLASGEQMESLRLDQFRAVLRQGLIHMHDKEPASLQLLRHSLRCAQCFGL
ncbi:hypothetical protein A6D6_02099 [Alcanivorax xiamenensis]|uniref:3-hydroxyisobutyrate dehydrogenase n=1 Tax=Alcanivorax xiamenensis TaxID=1177156 RepID=A0ABQ6Y7W7_9GAMM|nr:MULTISPECIES: hypothetical protein [Alcanivorax]KAF0805651.1 hypothetical protein A6D6_02099 [Alcanivorax xiamenensis]